MSRSYGASRLGRIVLSVFGILTGMSWANLAFARVVNAVAVDPVTPSTLYAGTLQGVFKSTDGGENWVAINAGLPNLSIRALVVDPVSPQRPVYVATEGSGVSVLRQNVGPLLKAPLMTRDH